MPSMTMESVRSSGSPAGGGERPKAPSAPVRMARKPYQRRRWDGWSHRQMGSAVVGFRLIHQARLKGGLEGAFVYKFDCAGQEFLLAYEYDPATRVLLALGVDENFYRYTAQ